MRTHRTRPRPSATLVVAALVLAAALTGTAYAAATVGTADLRNRAVTTRKLANRAVTARKLASAAVTNGKLATGAVTTAKLAPAAVRTANLAAGAVTTAAIAHGAVTTAKLADGAVTTAKLASGAVTSANLASGAVTTDAIAPDAVTADKVGTEALSGDEIADDTITGQDVEEPSLDLSSFFASAESGPVSCTADTGPETCGLLNLNLARATPVLVAVSGGWQAVSFSPAVNPGLADRAFGHCQLRVDGVPGAQVEVGLAAVNTHPTFQTLGALSLVDLVPLGAGAHAIQLQCTDADRDIDFYNVRLVAIQVNS